MIDNPTNQAQSPINSDLQQTIHAPDSVVKESQKLWSLPTLERALLTVIGFLAFFLAFRAGRSIMEWQFGLTITLATVMTIVIPMLLRENNRVTRELDDKPFCPCFFCAIDTIFFVGIGLIPVLAVWIAGKTSYKLIAGLGGILIVFVPLLYLENERVSSRLGEEITKPRTFRHALTFLGLAIIMGSVGWIGGTLTRTFIEIAVPKLTLL